MPRYLLHGRTLLSDMALPELLELPPAAGAAGPSDLRFARATPDAGGGPWFVIWRLPNGDTWVRARRTAHGYRIQYVDCADFGVDLARRAIVGEAIECAEWRFRHFLIDQVVPLMLSVDAPVLHASSIVLDGGSIVAFTGDGGAGKSTLAMSLARLGHVVGSDDALSIALGREGVRATPSYPGLRLHHDSEQAVAEGLTGGGRQNDRVKQRFSRGLRFDAAEGELAQLYVIDTAPSPVLALTRLSARDTMMELVRESYRLALDDREALRREVDTLAVLAERLPCWRLAFPRDLARHAAMAGGVAEHIRAHARLRGVA